MEYEYTITLSAISLYHSKMGNCLIPIDLIPIITEYVFIISRYNMPIYHSKMEYAIISQGLCMTMYLCDLMVEYTKTSPLITKGRHQHSLPLTTNLSQRLTQLSKGISYPVGDHCSLFTKSTEPSVCTLHSNLRPQQMVQIAFCDLP